MENTLWRFGDSWSLTSDHIHKHIESNHSKYISDYFGVKLKHLGKGGFSNLEIFHTLLSNNNNYKKNDIILINFASTSRCAIIENDKVSCTANGSELVESNKIMMDILINDLQYPISNILFYLIKVYLEQLINKGIRVYHFFNDYHNNYCTDIDGVLIFNKNGYTDWCIENGYQDLSPNGNLHYTLGSQKSIANKIIQLIEKYDNQEK
jgi:hypothetical protein